MIEKSILEKRKRGRPKNVETGTTRRRRTTEVKGDRLNELKLKEYTEFQIESGGSGKKPYKTIHFKLHGHLVCNDFDAINLVKYFYFQIRQTIRKNLNTDYYNPRFIHTMDISDSFKRKPYTYYNFDFTLFCDVPKHRNFHASYLNSLVEIIHKEHFVNPPFKVYRDKKSFLADNNNVYDFREKR